MLSGRRDETSCRATASGRCARRRLPVDGAAAPGPRVPACGADPEVAVRPDPVPRQPAALARPRDAAARSCRRPVRGVLTGLDPATRAVLALLDGTRDTRAGRAPRRPRSAATRRARRRCWPCCARPACCDDATERWPLGAGRRRAGAAGPGRRLARPDDRRRPACPSLRRRQQAQVVVLGAGRVGAPLAGAARRRRGRRASTSSTTGRPAAAGHSASAGCAPPTSAGAAARRPATGCASSRRRPAAGPVPRPDLVVLAPRGPADDADAAGAGPRGTAPPARRGPGHGRASSARSCCPAARRACAAWT